MRPTLQLLRTCVHACWQQVPAQLVLLRVLLQAHRLADGAWVVQRRPSSLWKSAWQSFSR